jgi:hypothetical protein
MRLRLFLVCLLLPAARVPAQTLSTPAPNSSATAASSPTVSSASMTSILPDLDRLQAAASQAAVNIGHMRIEKWKVDGESKRQAQSNADSVQRNLTSALPGLIEGVRSAPQDLNAEFRLYRNLNALYDVMGTLAESTGAFGPRSDYEALAEQFQIIATVRRNLGDALDRLTAATQSELTQLRNQVRAQQQVATTPAAPPKKVVVDDTEPTPKTVRKKKKPVSSGSSGSNDAGSSTPSDSAPAPKS